jgi:predicted ArsR family transcriptional regulator
MQENAPKLTARQKIFFMKIMKKFLETKKPIHYRELAEELGLSESTAYKILRVLEKKELMESEYILPSEGGKQGRSKIFFRLSQKNIENYLRPLGGYDADGDQIRDFWIRYLKEQNSHNSDVYRDDKLTEYLLNIASKEDENLAPQYKTYQENEEWDDLIKSILFTINNEKTNDPTQTIYMISALFRTTRSSLSLCAEIITVVLITLSSKDNNYDIKSELKKLVDLPASKENIILLLGLSWGFALTNSKLHWLVGDIRRQGIAFIEAINRLSSEQILDLNKYAIDVWNCMYSDESVHKSM